MWCTQQWKVSADLFCQSIFLQPVFLDGHLLLYSLCWLFLRLVAFLFDGTDGTLQELESLEKRGQGIKTKMETQAKYGW